VPPGEPVGVVDTSMTQRVRISFDRADAFRRELERNIAKGGVFVPGASGLELRELVEAEIALDFVGESRSLEAEVVHIAEGGVALQFRRPAADLRDEFTALLARAQEAAAAEAPGSDDSLDSLEIGDLEEDLFDSGGGTLDAELASFVECRRAPRARVRVPARLDGNNARVDGVTRDLSETGALISADASELPLGKTVRLQLRNPDTGDPLEVSGRVMRHVETPGTVAAVSVDFDLSPEQKPDLAALVQAAEQAHRKRSAAGISGRIEELGMPNLIQMLGRSSPRGTLSASSGPEEAVIAFEAGNLRYVRLGAASGLKALARILQWTTGSFEFHAHVDALDNEDQPMGLEAALLEATRRLDEAVRAGAPRLDPKMRFGVDRAALAANGPFEKVEEAVLDLAAAGFTFRRIIDVVPVGDAQISEALLSLIERGVLTPSS
jgi:PilZ domain/Domain of unknown function (DUF4388)